MEAKILATVGTKTITEADVDAFIMQLGQRGQAYQNPQGRAMVLEQLINKALLVLDATRNLYERDAEFKAELDYLVEYYKQYNYTAEYIREQMGDDAIKESALFGKIEKLIMERITIKYE
jgi:predicted ArsR family transcriptional regulator